MNKEEIERELRLLAQQIGHEVKTPIIKEKMLDRIRNILTLMECKIKSYRGDLKWIK